jgi:hypothetical protein
MNAVDNPIPFWATSHRDLDFTIPEVQWPGSYVEPLNTLREIPWWTISQLKYLDPIALHERPTKPFRMRVRSHTSCLYNVPWNKRRDTHKLVHTINRSLDRESNPRPLAYGNTASIKGTTTLTTKPNPLLQNRRFNDQGCT